MPPRRASEGLEALLGEAVEAMEHLGEASRRILRGLVAQSAAQRVAGLDGAQALLWIEGEPGPEAPALLPPLLSLASAPRYPDAAALLLRITHLLAAIDDPPRSFEPSAHPGSRRREVYAALEGYLPRLLRVAGKGRDPQAARLAACLCARFPSVDAQSAGLLLALLSGSADPDERARLIYALARVQLGLGLPLHPRIEAASRGESSEAEALAAWLAMASHDPQGPLRLELAERLRRAAAAPPECFPDPTSWGRRLPPQTLEAALQRLASGPRG